MKEEERQGRFLKFLLPQKSNDASMSYKKMFINKLKKLEKVLTIIIKFCILLGEKKEGGYSGDTGRKIYSRS